MKTELYSISKIFTERLLRIPDYQRGYAWVEKHWKEYWGDLFQLERYKNHYVGVLTLEETPKESLMTSWTEDLWIIQSKGFMPFYVVDGQQRLTTTIILIQCICEVIGDEGVLNYTTVPEIRKKFIYDSKDEGISRSYLFGYEKDNPSYDFLKAKVFNESCNTPRPLEETIYTQNLINAKNYFLDKLRKLDSDKVADIFKKVTQHFLFAIYYMSDDIDVHITFETMNNRGKPLSHLELLKNRLIYLTTKFNTEESEKKQLRRIINDCWRAIYHHLGRNKDKPLDDDLFLLNHFLLYFGEELAKDKSYSVQQLRRGYRYSFQNYLLEKKFTVRNIKAEIPLTLQYVNDYAISLKTSVEVWYQLLNPENSEYTEQIKFWLGKLNRIGIINFLPLIMIFFKECDSEKLRISLLKYIERFAFHLSLVNYYYFLDFDESLFIEIANAINVKELTPENAVKKIQQIIEKNLNQPGVMKAIKDNFKKKTFYSWRSIKYLLYEYEVSLKEKSKTYTTKCNFSKTPWHVLKK